jgi:hypothetical protein
MWRGVLESPPRGLGQILTGGVAVCGDELRVTALLSDASTSRVIWGETFRRQAPPGQILKVRDEVAEALAGALHDFLRASAEGCDQVKLPMDQPRRMRHRSSAAVNIRAHASARSTDADAEAMARDRRSR